MKSFAQITKEEEQKALRIHKGAVVIDGLCAAIVSGGQFDRMLQGGVTAANWTIVDVDHDLRQAVLDIATWYSLFRANRDKIALVTGTEDIAQAKKRSQLGIIFGLQDPKPIEDSRGQISSGETLLECLYKLGLRVIQLTYNEKCLIGDGTTEQTDSGLSRFGKRIVDEMNRLGILIDVSHCGPRTAIEAAERSRDPVIFSHANAKALCRSARNKSDDELKLIAQKGGVIGASAFPPLIWSKEDQQPTIDDFLSQIDYMTKLVGTDHVGLGLDITERLYEGERGKAEDVAYTAKYPEVFPPWLTSASTARELASYADLPNITKGLVARGYSEEDIRKILGENFLRVFERVWK